VWAQAPAVVRAGQNRPPTTLDDLTQKKALLLQRFFFYLIAYSALQAMV
jgi:hypothetical protein